MTYLTDNGWRSDPALSPIKTNGVITEVHEGNVAYIMQYVADWWHKNIDPVTQMRAYRSQKDNDKLPNSIKSSNHVSGTANDINWTKHPYGKKGTFTSAQLTKMRALERYLNKTIAFGEFYPADRGTSYVDPTHVEIARGVSDSALSAVVRKIKADKAAAAAKEAAKKKEEDMPKKLVRHLRTKDTQKIPAKTWTRLYIDDASGNVTILGNETDYFDALILIRLTGIKHAAKIRVYRDLTDSKGATIKKAATYPLSEIPATAGDTYGQYSMNGGLPKDNRLRVELYVDEPATVTRFESRVGYW